MAVPRCVEEGGQHAKCSTPMKEWDIGQIPGEGLDLCRQQTMHLLFAVMSN